MGLGGGYMWFGNNQDQIVGWKRGSPYSPLRKKKIHVFILKVRIREEKIERERERYFLSPGSLPRWSQYLDGSRESAVSSMSLLWVQAPKHAVHLLLLFLDN